MEKTCDLSQLHIMNTKQCFSVGLLVTLVIVVTLLIVKSEVLRALCMRALSVQCLI